MIVPEPPSLLGALREAISDLFHNWRIVLANLVWGVALLAVLAAAAVWPPLILLMGLVAVPAAGVYRMATLIARGRDAGLGEFVDGARRVAWPAFAVGTLATVLTLLATANFFIGLQMGDLIGLIFSGLAIYAGVALVMVLVAAWPILVDPLREELPIRRRLWLAALLNFARPGRMFVFSLVVVALMLLSAAIVALLLAISLAYVSLASARYVLPAIDRLEGRPSVPSPE